MKIYLCDPEKNKTCIAKIEPSYADICGYICTMTKHVEAAKLDEFGCPIVVEDEDYEDFALEDEI